MKLYYLFFGLLVSSGIQAQVLQVDSLQEIKLTHPVEKAELAPSGQFMLLSDYNYQGITKVDLDTRQEQTITSAPGAGYRPKILSNGDIVYREVAHTPLKKTIIKRYKLADNSSETVVPSTRDNIQPVSALEMNHVVTNEDFHLELTLNGNQTTLAPLGADKRYIWPSISPDGNHLLFFVSSQGAYVSDMEGKNVHSLGIVRAPKWYTNSIVVGQRDTDNGEVVVSSAIVAKNIITDVEQILTADSMIAMYPSASADGGKILFSTPDGRVFIIHVQRELK